jgi:crotonobetainyl-CoA:carnitine CoA-transferase CaiB-like acyl-CoA transferase
VLRLCRDADVFVSSIRPDSARRLGLDYDSVKAVRPDIVYCAACGFGESGPYRGKAAYDDVIQAASGISGLLQQKTGAAEYLPVALCDKVSGMTMVYAILAALLHRERTGKGQLVETPMFEASVAFNLLEHVCGYVFDPPLGEFGWSRMLSPSRHPFRTKDGFACIMPYTDRNWSDFFAAIGRPKLSHDPRFARHALRIQNIAILYGIIEEHAPERTNREWIELCDRLSIPCMPVIPPTELWDDPHIRATGLLGLAEHPTEGRYRTIGSPVTFSETPTGIRKHAPNLGEDTVSVMRAAGLSEDEIELLLARRVLRQFKQEPAAAAGD